MSKILTRLYVLHSVLFLNILDCLNYVALAISRGVIREGLELSIKLANHFIEKDVNFERAFKFQWEIQNCISGYQELYKKLAKPSQFFTDYIVKGKKSTCEVVTNFTCEESLSSRHMYICT
jgi:hypothetical protein